MQNGLPRTRNPRGSNDDSDSAARRLSASFSNGTPLSRPHVVDTTHRPSVNTNEPPTEFIAQIRLSDKLTEDDEEFEIDDYTDDDLKALKVNDPFLYYSIPEVRRASFNIAGDDDDDDEDRVDEEIKRQFDAESTIVQATSLGTSVNTSNSANPNPPPPPPRRNVSRATSCPAGMLASADIARSQLLAGTTNGRVRRSVRLSVEAHPSLMLQSLEEEIMNGGGGDSEEEESEDDERIRRLVDDLKRKM